MIPHRITDNPGPLEIALADLERAIWKWVDEATDENLNGIIRAANRVNRHRSEKHRSIDLSNYTIER